MNSRIPICYDRVLRPEWLDYALEQSVKLAEEQELTRILRTHLSAGSQLRRPSVRRFASSFLS